MIQCLPTHTYQEHTDLKFLCFLFYFIFFFMFSFSIGQFNQNYASPKFLLLPLLLPLLIIIILVFTMCIVCTDV